MGDLKDHLFCVLQKLQTIAEDFCGLDVNTPLGGQEPMTAIPVLTFNTLSTAVAATSTGDFTVVFIGTQHGHLKKVSHYFPITKKYIENKKNPSAKEGKKKTKTICRMKKI